MAKHVWLRYRDNAGVLQDLRIIASSRDKAKPTKEGGIALTLSGHEFEILTSWRMTRELIISRLYVSANRDFLQQWYIRVERYIAISDSLTVPIDSDFIPVSCGTGDAPVDYLRGHHALPIWSLVLREKRSRL